MSEITSPITFTADVEIAQKLRVKIKAGSVTEPPEVDIAGVGEHGVGINQYLVSAAKDCAVVPFNKEGTMEMVAAGAFAIGATIYAAANGKVDDVPSGKSIGKAMEAATADGDIVEILPSLDAVETAQLTHTNIATTGNTDAYLTVPKSGTIVGIDFAASSTEAASDTNYITFTITNLGQAGAGTAELLGAVDANTTKATGGTGVTANARRSMTLSAVLADLEVAEGDRLFIRAAVTGTLGGAVIEPTYMIRVG